MVNIFMTLIDKFMSKVFKQKNGCWAWTGAIIKSTGYGRFCFNRKDIDYAHRASYRIHIGEIKKRHYVCHKCDNPSCVNPDHLFLGTPKENMVDASKKGRIKFPKEFCLSDENHPRSKLTNTEVLFIRKTNLGSFELSRKFNVTPQTIWRIRTGKSFRDIL